MGIQGWDRVTLHILPSGLEAPAPGRGIASRPLHNVCVSSLSLDPGPFLLFGDPWASAKTHGFHTQLDEGPETP